MPVCNTCKTNNNVESKTCKNCGQALIMYDEKVCSFCHAMNGIYAKSCQSCASSFYSEVLTKHGTKSSELYELLKKSYLYHAKNETFAELKCSITEIKDKIQFRLGEDVYVFEEADDLRNIFNVDEHPIPNYIRVNAARLIRPVFEKYSKETKIELLDDMFDFREMDILYTCANENGQLAASKMIDIFEEDLKSNIVMFVDICSESSSYLNFERNLVHQALVETMYDFDYRFEILSQNNEHYVYRLGENNIITVHCTADKHFLKITYLNGTLRLTSDDIPCLSIILLNWMLNINRVSMTVNKRMNQLMKSSTTTLQSIKKLTNKTYRLTENKDVSMDVLSENIVQFTFQGLSSEVTQPIHPNMPHDEFEQLLHNMITFSTNNNMIEYIRMIEETSQNDIDIIVLRHSSCKVIIYTKNVTLTSFVLNSDTRHDEMLKYINKINFLENIIGN